MAVLQSFYCGLYIFLPNVFDLNIKQLAAFSNLNDRILLSGGFDESYFLNRGFYMSAHILLNLLNKLRKRDKM